MNRGLWAVVALACLCGGAFSAPQPFDCSSIVETSRLDTRVKIPLPVLSAVIEAITSVAGVSVKLSIDLGYTIKSTLTCDCQLKCCEPPGSPLDEPREFRASLSLMGEAAPPEKLLLSPGSTVAFPLASNVCRREIPYGAEPLCIWPDACTVEFRQAEIRIGIEVGLEWLLDLTRTTVRTITQQVCRCAPYEGYCFRLDLNHPPRLIVPTPVVLQGSDRTFRVWVDDPDDDVVEIRAFDEQGKELPVRLIRGPVEWIAGISAIRGAEITVPDGVQRLTVTARDRCGNTVKVSNIAIHVNNPVRLSVTEETWEYGEYIVRGKAFDMDLKRCYPELEVFECLTFTCAVVSSGGGTFTNAFGESSWMRGCFEHRNGEVPFAAVYRPARGGTRLAYLFIKVADAWGSEDHWSKKVENLLPHIKFKGVSPPASSPVKVKRGEWVTAVVEATDPEGDWVTLEKVSGPGTFPKVEGQGEASGDYSWRATTSQPWWLVQFRAYDPYPGFASAYLLIHVLQPPRAYGDSAWVPRGGSTTTTLYVDDPDSSSHTFAFSPPEGITVRVVGKEDLPEYYGEYYAHLYRVEVSVDPRLCDGT